MPLTEPEQPFILADMEQQIVNAYNQGMPIPPEMDAKLLCEQIELLREQVGRSQKDVCKAIPVTERGYRYWLEGQRVPNGKALFSLFRLRDELETQVKRMKKNRETDQDKGGE